MKNYVLCTTLESDCIETLKRIKNDIDINQAFIHIIQVVEIQIYSSESLSSVYPKESDYNEIETHSLNVMKRLADKIGITEGKLVLKCFFELSREAKITNYLKEVNADLVVTTTRGKYGIDGFFTSSFTDYLCKFSPCDVLVMRPAKT